ncbi:MAG: bifunctional demethylmenaquinone methyltransferase/2-methoxy-6-polyprenyl-1,4-benzoquinol methylase UbiE [Myxococcota bacterium]|nr:bifunctional demethylmenaquinone methyltransferase/2-methoxy-6-polyprenyl-1,4-benzoquinol methylase UbiE [Myxococcota bacterium]
MRTEPAIPVRAQTWRIFDRIAPTYDRVNRVLSVGRDVSWRKFVVRCLPDREQLRVLDLATGTADLALTLAGDARVAHVRGMDLSEGMLAVGTEKIHARGLANRVELERGDVADLPLDDGSHDVVTIAFGIRNVENFQRGLTEIHRVLVPGGTALVLEFSLPPNPLVRALYLPYFRHVLPRIGGWISGDPEAYRYLNRSVEAFPYGGAFCECLREAGFERVRAVPLTLGIATLYVAEKSASGLEPVPSA